MKNLFILFLLFSTTVFASGWRKWGEPQPPSKANYYISIRGGIGQMSADMKNSIPSFSTSYCQYLDSDDGTNDGDVVGYGPCHAWDDDVINTEIAKWDEYTPNTNEMSETTGFYGVSFGGYLPNHSKIRIELEWLRHIDFDYSDDRIYVGYPRVNPDDDPDLGWIPDTELDDQMEAFFKSTVSSSHILFNVYYDFTNNGRTIGEWTPYVGLGVGLAQNKTNFTLIDPQSELVYEQADYESAALTN